MTIAFLLPAILFRIGGAMPPESKELYRARLAVDPPRELAVLQTGTRQLTLSLSGPAGVLELPVTGGGVSACATILRHRSENARAVLTLPIPDLRARCRMLPGSVSLKSTAPEISLPKTTLSKVAGADRRLRKIVFTLYGEVR